jgi:hypothetical protein
MNREREHHGLYSSRSKGGRLAVCCCTLQISRSNALASSLAYRRTQISFKDDVSLEKGSLEVILGSAAPFVGMIHKFQKKKTAPLEIEDKQEFTIFVLKESQVLHCCRCRYKGSFFSFYSKFPMNSQPQTHLWL